MPKPGQSPNIENVTVSESDGVAAAARYGMGSNQDPATTQTASRDPRRMAPPSGPAGPSGKADVEVSGVMDGQTSDYTSSMKTNYASRKKILG